MADNYQNIEEAVNDHNETARQPETEDTNFQVVRGTSNSCGCGSCTPSWLQSCANPKLFTAHCIAIIAISVCALAYLGGVLTTIERQFQLSSSESGTITVINDLVSIFLVIVVSYFGHDSHRPRWLAVGTILTGIGTLMFTMPHFLSDPLDPGDVLYGKAAHYQVSECIVERSGTDNVEYLASWEKNVTLITNSSLHDAAECGSSSGGLGWGPIWWIICGSVLYGIGNSPMYSLMTTYIDDAVGKRRLVSYMAFIFMSFAIGPSLGFLLSAQTTKLYVDFDRIPAEDIPDLEQWDPRWIGAWWLGFVFCGVFLIILGVPMFFYPRLMVDHSSSPDADNTEPSYDENDNDDFSETLGQSVFVKKEGQNGLVDVIKGLLSAVKRLIFNPVVVFKALGDSADTAAVGIFAAFSVKYLQSQFGLSPGTSGMLVGGAIIPCNIISNLISAWIVRRFKLTVRQCAIFILITLSLAGATLPIMMTVGCENPEAAGITSPYSVDMDAHLLNDSNVNIKPEATEQLISSCNSDCQCPTHVFQPVCGSDGINYISPCLAGCTGKEVTQNASDDGSPSIIYTNCSCIVTSFNNSNNTAQPGQCPITCSGFKLTLFVVLYALSFFLQVLNGNPPIYILLRSVKSEDRSVAVGFQTFITRVLGFLPSPVYFGAIINTTCLLWQYTCDERGACWIYDIVKYRYSYFGTLLVLRVCGLFCYVIMYFSIKPENPKANNEVKKHPDEDTHLKLEASN